MAVLRIASAIAPATGTPRDQLPCTRLLMRPGDNEDPRPGWERRPPIDESMFPLRALPEVRLNAEIGERLGQIAPIQRCLCVLIDHGCAGLSAIAPRMHGTLSAELQRLYASLIFERDPLLARATQDWRPLTGTIEEHCTWIGQHTRHGDVIEAWLLRAAAHGSTHLAVIPARGWLSRGALFAFFSHHPPDSGIYALFYAAQCLAASLELRYRPYTSELLSMRFTARERDVLRAGLRGAVDRQIAQRMGLSVDSIRYYFSRIKQRAPAAVGHLKPRELARVLHELGTL